MTDISENYKRIIERVDAVAEGKKVILVGVAKTKSTEAVREAIAAGLTSVGENYVQEFLKKDEEKAYEGASVHVVGQLQRNKARYVTGRVELIQSVNSEELMGEISRRAMALGITQDVLLEVNIGREQQKNGWLPERIEEAAACAGKYTGLRVKGLMTIPPAENSTGYFRKMYNIYIDIKSKKYDNVSMDFLSMGMSGDFETAIREGANMIRVGTALFGPRDYLRK